MAGFDAGETVTIPPLADLAMWERMSGARLGLQPHLPRRDVAERYRPRLAA